MATQQQQQQPQPANSRHSEAFVDEIGTQGEKLAAIVALLQPFGVLSVKVLRQALGYARRHPVRIAASVVAIGVMGAFLMRPKAAQELH